MKYLILILLIFTTLFATEKITAVIPKNISPYYINKDNQTSGFAIEVFNEVSKIAGYEVEYKEKNSLNEVLNTFDKKLADVIPNNAISEKRKENSFFSTPINTFNIRAYKRKDSHFNSFKEINNKKVVILSSNIVKKLMKKHKKELLIEKNNVKDAIFSLVSGEADVLILPDILSYFFYEYNLENEIISFDKSLKEVKRAIRVHKSNPELFNKLNNSLIEFKKTEKFKNIYKKWFQKSINENNKLYLNEEEKKWLNENRVINVGFSTNFAPLFMIKDEKPIGMIPDFYKLISDKYGLKFNLITKDWKDIIKDTKNGKIDVIPFMNNKIAKENNLLTTDGIFLNLFTVYGKNNIKYKINSISDLEGLKISYVKDILILDKFLKNKNFQLLQSASPDEALHNVINEKADVAILFKISGDYLLNKYFLNTIKPIYTLNELKVNTITAISPKLNILQSIHSKINNSISYDEKIKVINKWGINKELKPTILLSITEKNIISKIKLNNYLTHWEPFTFQNDDLIEGLSADIWKELIKKSALEYQHIKVSKFAEALEKIKLDKNGSIIATSSTKDREKYGVFTKSYASFPIAIVTDIKKPFISELKEFEGKTIAVGENYTAYKLLKKHYPKIKFIQTKDTLEALNLVANNKAYAAADISPAIIHYMNRYGFNSLKIAALSPFKFELKIMLNKANKDLIPILDKLIDSIDSDTKQNIINKWVYTKEVIKVDYTLVYIISIISIIVILLLLYGYRIKSKYQKNLEDSEYRWKFAVEGSGDGLWDWNLQTNSVYFSPQWKKMLGFEDNEISGSLEEWEKRVNPKQLEKVYKDITNHLEGKTKVYQNIHQVLCKDGSYKWILDRGVIVQKDKNNNPIRMIGTHTDISQQKELEKEILKEKIKYENIMNLSSDAIFIMDKKGKLLEYSKQTKILLGYSDEEMKKLTVYDWDKSLQIEEFEKLLEILSDKPINIERKHTKKDGNSYIASINASFLNINNNEYIYASTRDTTKEKNFQKQLINQKEEFESIFKNSKDGIAITDLKTNFLEFNDAYLELTNYSQKELYDKSLYILTADKDKTKIENILDNKLDKNNYENFEQELNINDRKIVVNTTISLLPDKKRFLIVTKDVSHIKQIEIQSKLASMGEMIGNIAHQWRQPLTVISSHASGLKLKLDFEGKVDNETLIESCDNIVKQTKYLSKTIDDFKNFIKDNKEFKEFNVSEMINSSISLIDSTLKNNFIEVVLNIDSDIKIYGNKNELQQAFINILNNAKDAIVENIVDDEDKLIFIDTELLNENSLKLSIYDSAGGIKNDILNKLFEPYFTTKHQSIGTGLGLTMADKIIRDRHKFNIYVENKEFTYKNNRYKGANFNIIFST